MRYLQEGPGLPQTLAGMAAQEAARLVGCPLSQCCRCAHAAPARRHCRCQLPCGDSPRLSACGPVHTHVVAVTIIRAEQQA